MIEKNLPPRKRTFLAYAISRMDEAYWLVHLSPDRAVQVQALAGDTVVFLGKTLKLSVPLSNQQYKWVLANCWGNLRKCGE